jgi:hypothetical protein
MLKNVNGQFHLEQKRTMQIMYLLIGLSPYNASYWSKSIEYKKNTHLEALLSNNGDDESISQQLLQLAQFSISTQITSANITP